MNERILELYKQAHVPSTAIDPSNNMPYKTTTFSAEKFSELIVQESCYKLMEMHEKANCVHNYYHYASVQLKRHFGFEK